MTTQDSSERRSNRRSAERRQADRALRECEERYRALFDSVDCVFLLDFEGRFLDANPAALELLGYEHKEILALSFSSLLDDDQPARASGVLAELKETRNQKTPIEFRLRRKTGENADVELKASLVFRDGQPYAVLGVGHDITERKGAEEALRRANERLLLATAAGGVGIWDLDVLSNRLTWDDQMFCLYGMEPDNFGGAYETWKARVHPEDAKRGDAEVQMALRGEKEFDTEFRVIWPSGDVHHIRARAQVHRDAAGQPTRLIGTNYDVTERKELEESLRRTQFVVDHSQEQIHWLSPEGRFLYVNEAGCRRLGYSREELLGMTVNDIAPTAPRPWSSRFQEIRERGSFTFESQHRTKDGEIFPVEVAVSYVNYGGQEYSCASARDITERKQAEELLRLTQFSVDRAADPVFWTDSDGHFIFVSDSTCRLHGYSRDEMLGMTLFDIDPSLSAERWATDWKRMKEQGSFTFETVSRLKDGTVLPVEVTVNYLEFNGKEYNCAFVRDITDRLRADEERLLLERQLQQSQRLESLGVLAGGIAHDFNNILMSVLGNAELALTGLSPASPARENLLEITASSRRAADLCRQMLAYSGRGHFVTEAIDLRALIEDMLGLLQSTISKKALLNLNMGKNLPSMRGDASQVSQVIMNLVINASEAIGERSGVVTISTGVTECTGEYLKKTYGERNLATGLYLTLEVSDTGAGMDAETQKHLFEPFFTTKFTGRGLGLSAVLGIVRGHQGALRLYSELGKGTTFKILFPVSETAAESLARANGASKDDWRGEGTILLVDDEETIRTLGVRMLASLGFTVLTAADGREALSVYAEHRDEITLVLLDLTMPHMDGEQTFRELRLIDPGVRVVMSSGYAENDITARFAGKGLVGFVHKPYSLAELAEQLRAALEGVEPGSGTVRT